MRRQYEAGVSIAGFLVTCVILAVLLVGGIYAAKQNGWLAMNNDSASDQTPSKPNQSADRDQASRSSNGTSSDQKKGSEDAKTEAEKQSDQPAASNQGETQTGSNQPDNSSTSQPPAGGNTGSDDQATAAEALPQTGPAEDSLVSLVAIGSLTLAVGIYIRSRQA